MVAECLQLYLSVIYWLPWPVMPEHFSLSVISVGIIGVLWMDHRLVLLRMRPSVLHMHNMAAMPLNIAHHRLMIKISIWNFLWVKNINNILGAEMTVNVASIPGWMVPQNFLGKSSIALSTIQPVWKTLCWLLLGMYHYYYSKNNESGPKKNGSDSHVHIMYVGIILEYLVVKRIRNNSGIIRWLLGIKA